MTSPRSAVRGGPLYKIVPAADWKASAGQVPWAPIDETDGFIHLSAAHQLRQTAAKHFGGRDDLVVVEVDPERLAPGTLKWEISRGGDAFPHVYGDVPHEAVGRATALTTMDGVDGSAHLPEPLPDDAGPAAVARRLELAEAAVSIAVGRAAGSDVVVRGTGVASCFGPSSPLNAIKGWGLDAPASIEDLRTFQQYFGDATHAVEVSSHADPDTWAILNDSGYRASEIENVLFRPIEAPLPSPPAEVVLEPVRPAEAQAWAALVARGFSEGDAPPGSLVSIGALFVRADQMRSFFLVVRGERVGGCVLRIEHELALLMSTSVLPAHRGQGIHTAAVAHRLVLAQRLGCRLAKVDVAPASGSHRNAHRAGFRISHTRVAFTRRATPPRAGWH